MNVTFNIGQKPDVIEAFLSEANKLRAYLEGYVLVWWPRASIYNAMPIEGFAMAPFFFLKKKSRVQ